MVLDKITYNMGRGQLNNANINGKKANVDIRELKRLLNDYHDMLHRTPYGDDGVYFLLSCITEAIKRCEFNDIQSAKLNMWFGGCTEKQIAEKYGVSVVAVHYFLVRACKRIAKNLERVVKECL